jgi:hypothetical protein
MRFAAACSGTKRGHVDRLSGAMRDEAQREVRFAQLGLDRLFR